MGSRHISLAGSMGLILVIGLGLASLRFATVFWTTAATTVTLAVLLGAILGAIYQRDAARAFCVGCAIFGLTYLVLVEWSWIGGQVGHDLTGGLSDLAEYVHPQPTPQMNPSPFGSNLPGRLPRLNPALFPTPAIEQSQQHYVKVGNFVQITRLSMTLLFAFLGATLARRFHTRTASAGLGSAAEGGPRVTAGTAFAARRTP